MSVDEALELFVSDFCPVEIEGTDSQAMFRYLFFKQRSPFYAELLLELRNVGGVCAHFECRTRNEGHTGRRCRLLRVRRKAYRKQSQNRDWKQPGDEAKIDTAKWKAVAH